MRAKRWRRGERVAIHSESANLLLSGPVREETCLPSWIKRPDMLVEYVRAYQAP